MNANQTLVQDDVLASESEHNFRRLVEQLRSNLGVIPFVGAGLSVPLGYPGWTAFLLTEAKRCAQERQIAAHLEAALYEDAAQSLREIQGTHEFDDAIDRTFGTHRLGRRKISSAVKWLPRISLGPVITTNFDRVLETTFSQAGKPFDAQVCGARCHLASKAAREDRRFLLKIHGDVEDRQDRVLTRSEYDEQYGPWEDEADDFPLRRLLLSLFETRVVLFVGCSLAADRTMHVLRQLARSRPELSHYAIVEAPARIADWLERRRFLSERGIRPLWYPSSRHVEVQRWLRKLAHGRERERSRPRSERRKRSPLPSAAELVETSTMAGTSSPAGPVSQSAPELPTPRSKVYVSCSWLLHDFTMLPQELRADGFQTLQDEGWTRSALTLSKTAVSALREAHVIVTLLTEESLADPQTRAELDRADSLLIKICAIVERTAITQLPWFVHAFAAVDGLEPAKVSLAVAEALHKLRSSQLSDYETMAVARAQLLSIFRVWKRETPGSSNRAWQLGLARQVVDNAAQELESLNKHRFEAYVGRGHNFLMRAKPVFECADRVFAVSVDTVSQFWVSEDRADQQIAKRYWQAQPSCTQRLFVFSSPESAHHYATILNIHARKYGETGRVYLCSATSYASFAASAGLLGTTCDHSACDYAALDYRTEAGTVTYVATLDADRFTVNKEPARELARQMDDFKQGMLRLGGLQPGDIDPETKIMRWRTDMQLEPQDWAERLKVLFGERRADVCHMVFVARDALDGPGVRVGLQAVIREIRNTLVELQRQHGEKIRLKHLWVGEAHRSAAHDGHFEGRINNDESSRYPLLLMMRFADEDGLLWWYGDKRHSGLRRQFYEILDRRVARLYADAESASRNQAAVIYEKIEDGISSVLSRRDYVEADTIEDVVRRRPFGPKVKFE